MKQVKQYMTEKNIFLLIIATYFITRFFNIFVLPIFTDESIYIYWAKLIAENHSYWFVSLTDGKPPLLIWMIAIFLKILPANLYLLAGRLPSILTGTVGVIGMYLLAKELFKQRKVAVMAALLYIISPFHLFYDRMALFDSMLSAMLLMSVYLGIRLSRTLAVKDSIFLGLFLGLSFLSKPTAIIFWLFTPLIVLLFTKKSVLKTKKVQMAKGIILALVIGQIINNLQRVSSVYFMMARKNQQFQQPLSELLSHPFALTFGNLTSIISWIITYYSLPIFIIGLAALIYTVIKKTRAGLLLSALWFTPLIIFATVARELFPRYVLFTTPYFLIALAYTISSYWPKKLLYQLAYLGVFAIIFFQSISFSYYLLTDPLKAPLPGVDYSQYISEHPSGYGVETIITFLTNEIKSKKVTLVTQGTFGLYPYAFDLAFWGNKNITILPRWPLSSIDEQITQARKNTTVYVLLKEHDAIPTTLPLKLVLRVEKPSRKFPLLLTTFQ